MPDLFPFYDDRITEFAELHTTGENELAAEVAEFTRKHHPEAHMLSDKQQGTFLKFVSCMMRPQKILEIGTFTGYSALMLAEGLQPEGMLHTIEFRPDTAEIARAYFDRSHLASKITLHTGDASQIIPTLNEIWDLVFIDADKTGYINYFNLVLPRVRQGGFILADNIFFHGRAFEDEPKGKSGKAIKAFNDFIAQQASVEKLALTIRDGVFVLRKL